MTGLNAPFVWSRLCAFCSEIHETFMVPWPVQDQLISQQENICFACAWRIKLQCETCCNYKDVSADTLSALRNSCDPMVPGRYCAACDKNPSAVIDSGEMDPLR